MELSKLMGITTIVLVMLGIVALFVIGSLGEGLQCPKGQHAVTFTSYNAALKLPTTLTYCQ